MIEAKQLCRSFGPTLAVDHLDLTIQDVNATISVFNTTLTCDVSGGTYIWLDCGDNTQINGAVSQSFTPTFTFALRMHWKPFYLEQYFLRVLRIESRSDEQQMNRTVLCRMPSLKHFHKKERIFHWA